MYFDWGGPLENLLQVSQSNSDGIVSFSALIPSVTVPGYYEVRILHQMI